ncbi:MAG TPA: cutinase family protein [Kofleriaceae bacterium]|nr:cutinase family protein [Kofleriaceae bacterium]
MKTIPCARVLSSTLLVGALALSACVAADDPAAASDDSTAEQAATTCAAVHIITARASTEAPGEGITGALVTQIINQSHQTITRDSVDYPATLTNYAQSSATGVAALKQLLTAQVQACPDQKIVLAGYSQGAHVILDVLGGGGGGTLGATTAPIAASIASHVVAAISFGDPRHVVNQSFDLGTSRRNGLFPRTAGQLQALAGFASKINAYCDANDEFCDSGLSLNVHLTYLDRYQNAAAQFVLGKIGG